MPADNPDLAASVTRLNKALVYDRPLCTAVNSFTLASEIAGGMIVQLTARPEFTSPC